MGILIMMLSGFVWLFHANKATNHSAFFASFSKLSAFIDQHRHHLQKNLTKAKQLVANKEEAEPPPIHFEFYTALPNMQVKVDTSNENEAKNFKPNMPVNTKTELALSNHLNQATTGNSEKVIVDANKSSSVTTNVNIVSANELERELSAQIQQDAYIVQIGIFKNAAAAERYRQSMAQLEYKLAVVKTMLAEKEVYRVQLGPFSDKTQAKLAQQRLLKKGLSGIVRKVETG